MALRPSFPVTSSAVPRLLDVDGRRRGFSGLLSGDASAQGSTYAIKVEDESAKINVNGGFLDTEDRDDLNQDGIPEGDGIPDHRDAWVMALRIPALPAGSSGIGRGWNGQLVRILNILGNQAEIGVATLGDRVLQTRPAGGYRSIVELQTLLGTAKDLSPWLTVSSWTDAKVIHPNGYAAEAQSSSMNGLKRNRSRLALEEGGRPPVNLNAASRPVLLALIQDLQGTCWQAIGSPGISCSINAPTASTIVDRMILRRTSSPFRTWGEFSAFADSLVTGGVIAIDTHAEDLLKSNFDPNSSLNKNLPDQLLYRWIDKSDLTVWSTEGSLGPTGSCQLSSLGRLLDGSGRLSAERTLSVIAETFRLLRQTTQQDFMAGRSPGSCLSLSPGTSFGYRTTGSTASWRSAAWGPGKGLAAMTYPCAPMAPASRLDGCIGLATVQDPESSPAQGPLLFLHHLDDGVDADVGTPKARQAGGWDATLETDPSQDLWPPPSTEPSVLLPDGLHAQEGRSPGFQALGNFPVSWVPGVDSFPSNHGVISYWIKTTVGWIQTSQFSCVRSDMLGNQVLAIGEGERGFGLWGFELESAVAPGDQNFERKAVVARGTSNFDHILFMPDLRWHLVTAWFDTDQTTLGQDISLDVRGVRTFNRFHSLLMPYPYLTSGNQDLFSPGTAFVLGAPAPGSIGATLLANQVIDEVAIYDFGDTGSGTGIAADFFAANRYADGRYYKGDDARFLSAVLEPDPGRRVRVLSARWTEYLPRESRQDIQSQLFSADQSVPRLLDTRLLNSRLELSLLDGAGDLTSAPLQALSQGGPVGLNLPRFQYRLRFINGIANPTENGVLETPFLDDITFTWQAMTGPRILGWGG